MNQPQSQDSRPGIQAGLAEAIRGSVLTLIIGGAVCLFFGFSLLIDAPGSVSDEVAKTWYALDRAFQWALRIVGAVFLIAAAWASTGQRASMLLAALAELAFGLLMLAMAIETTIEARADGQMDAFAILYGILFLVGLSGAKRSWNLYVFPGPSPTSHGQPFDPASP